MFETIQFDSLDGIQISADYYPLKKAKQLILLCHRSHSNRGEYRKIAPPFQACGYACLAINQRSGMIFFGLKNENQIASKSPRTAN